MRRQWFPLNGLVKVMVKHWVENSERENLKVELVLKRHQIEAVEWLLLEKKPSKPKDDSKEEGGERVNGSKRKTMSGEFEEIRWWGALRVGEFAIPLQLQ